MQQESQTAADMEPVPQKQGQTEAVTRRTFLQKTSVVAGGLLAIPPTADALTKKETKMKKFAIHIPEPELDGLRKRIISTRWPDNPEGESWRYGTNRTYLQELSHYWAKDFDWRKQEALLNKFQQYKVQIDDCLVHFIHEKGKGPNPLPIVISHGWPSSFMEMYKIIPMLTDPAHHGGHADDSFDVIVPSLPGFGFSSPRRQGHMRAHELWAKLMTEILGYSKFIAQGGDVGAGVTSLLGRFYPKKLFGIHISGVDLLFPASLPDPSQLSEAERKYISSLGTWEKEENGYGHIQGTRPQTLAYGLNDSPVGLAAWIIEKFHNWSDCHGNIETRFSKDDLLTNITIYWVTQTINSSMRHYFYSQNRVNAPPPLRNGERIDVPTGVAMFPGERDLIVPREFAQRVYNIAHWTDMPSGGHFAALEEPELLVDDIRTFAKLFR
ncbi:MAG TPA: epoxide hydrolase [Candidatus Udaeobacter sp.]|nr:epoxide hydrolase [Candidatus Udaeobacter sp.]